MIRGIERDESGFNKAGRLGRLRSHIVRWGVLRSLYYIVMTLANRIGIFVVVVRTHLIEPEPQYPATLPGLEFRVIRTKELLRAGDDPALPLSREFVDAAINRGDFAVGAFDGDVLVAYVWRSRSSAPHIDGLWVSVDKPYGYAYNSFTRPNYRGNRVSPILLLFSDVEMFELGFTHRTGFVAITNFSSLGASIRSGSQTIGHAGYVDWFKWWFTFRTKAVKKIGFRFFERK
jgi:hypothetical protein